SQDISTIEKKSQYHEKIDHLNELVDKSTNPEIQYQGISILHFSNNRSFEGLKAVKLAKKHAKENKTAPLSIYLALFLRAKYYSASENINDLQKARKDLTAISELKEIPVNKQKEIKIISLQVTEKLKALENRVKEKNAAMGIPIILRSVEFKVHSKKHNNQQSLYEKKIKTFLSEYVNEHSYNKLLGYLDRSEQTNTNSETLITNSLFTYYKSIRLYNSAVEKLKLGQKSAENDLNQAFELLDQVIEEGIVENSQLAHSFFVCCMIYTYSFDYLNALSRIEIATRLEPSNKQYNEYKGILEDRVLNLRLKRRLEWFDKLLIRDGLQDYYIDILLWKAEAHFLLDQHEKGKETAKLLLLHMKHAHPDYEIVFRMANSFFTF
ncbi:MAG TPA: hypothetical protein VGP47_05475, partial [Parachlamydiaceae bacterium]|nr:hypothetical protein [Parachlamydiaceae bacterium]